MSDDLPMFDFDAFRATFAPHWVHDRDSNRLGWHVQNRGDGIFTIEVSPPRQEMFGGPKDGEVHDVPFEFFLKDFLENPDLDIEEHGAISMNPSIFVKGTFKEAPFLLRIYLTPQTVDVYETLNTYTGKAIDREHSHSEPLRPRLEDRLRDARLRRNRPTRPRQLCSPKPHDRGPAGLFSNLPEPGQEALHDSLIGAIRSAGDDKVPPGRGTP
jgi:hypothetical protein